MDKRYRLSIICIVVYINRQIYRNDTVKQQRRPEAEEQAARKEAMAVLSAAPIAELKRLWSTAGLPEEAAPVRGPETGLVTVRGRIGGGGAPFNLGESTVTRATVRLADGRVGHSYALGRDRDKARLAAIADALWQDPARRVEIEAKLLAPLRAASAEADGKRRAETAATKVDFFTMVRGED
jgi:alpha-D-ribose 1-methylphosphonate 5-triphosphate synthase subunit PhnG